MTSADRLATGRMLVVTGKGGVGKTVVTAALGDALARAGRRVLLVEIDPRESLYHALAAPPSGGERLAVPLFTMPGFPAPARGRQGALWLQNLQPRHVIEQMVREQVRVDMVARKLLGSSAFQHFIEAAPGFKELAVLAYSMRALEAKDGRPPEVDTIVLDAPATGHGVSLLAAPRVVTRVIQEGPFGRMAREMTAFVADPARLGIVVVTRAEEMPALETRELFEMLEKRVQRRPDLLVANAVYPPLPEAFARLQAGARGEAPSTALMGLDAAARTWVERRRTNERELASLAALAVPVVELPLLPIDVGPRLIDALGLHLSPTLDVAADAA